MLEGVKGSRSVADIGRKLQISQPLYYTWRDRFLKGGKKALVNGAGDENAYKAEIKRFQKLIGKQAIQIEI